MTKVTHYMYSCDTCCISREMMEMDGLDSAKFQKSRRRDMMGIMGIVNEKKTKDEQCSSSSKETKKRFRRGLFMQWAGFLSFRERESSFSLGFRPFGPSIFDGARSKVALRDEGYAWAPIWWSSDNSKR